MGNPFGIHMNQLSGRNVKVLWYNPRDGQFTELAGEYANAGIARFIPPTNYDRDDWVLVLEDKDRNFPTEIA